jgi:hypothetical protein
MLGTDVIPKVAQGLLQNGKLAYEKVHFDAAGDVQYTWAGNICSSFSLIYLLKCYTTGPPTCRTV